MLTSDPHSRPDPGRAQSDLALSRAGVPAQPLPLLKTGALQSAIVNSTSFSSIATDERGVIQLFNRGAERMLGYAAVDVLNRLTPADLSDPQELVERAQALEIGRASCRERVCYVV